jgi:DNA-binding Xre family transcriptional regulator
MDRGYSIGKLAAISGVNHSEIHRVETGQTECRISTLLMLCAALGAAPAWLLDRVLWSNVGEFRQRILIDPDFAALMTRLIVSSDSVKSMIASNLACACVLASILLRCSIPQSRVKEVSFPQPEWKLVFTEFAAKIAPMEETIDRANILDGLLSFPVRELSNQGLLPEAILREQAEAHSKHSKYRAQYLWSPWVVPLPKPLRLN